MNSTKIIVALDYADAAPALALVERLDPALCRLKVGKELFTVAGPELVRALGQLRSRAARGGSLMQMTLLRKQGKT